MKIFGIGLNKTGTTTLGSALEILGYSKHVKSNLDLLKSWQEGHYEPLWRTVEQNNNFEDWPWPLVYQEVFEKYSDAKFILTVRKDENAWFKSLCKHAEKTGPTEHRKIVYGSYMPHDFEDTYKKFYMDHNVAVERFFEKHAPEQLLKICWEYDDGWKELCDYLKLEVPKKKFPVLNRSSKYSLGKKVSSWSLFKRKS